MIDHFYKCFGCGKQHTTGAAAIVCCAVVQEVWQCLRCGEQFATAGKAERHRRQCTANGYCVSTEPTDEIAYPCGTGQSFAAGFGNFSTP